MSVTDGTVVGTVQILNNGPATHRWNLVLMGDGYQAAQLGKFANDAQSFVNTLLATPPFDTFRKAINVFRVDVSSTDAGADDPVACGGTGATARTFFDAAFCNSNLQRLLTVNQTTALTVASAQVPQFHQAMVIVNSTVPGGSGGAVATFSTAPGAAEIGLHEMGHSAFGLSDEYEYFVECGRETDRNQHPALEPAAENVTINSNRSTIKWRDLVAAATPMPTTSNPDCTKCDTQANPVSATTVGAFEGADHFHCGAFRPQFNCRMRTLGQPFCAVCRRRIHRVLYPYFPGRRGGAYEVRVEPGSTGIVALPPPKLTGVIPFGRVFVSLASDFEGASVRFAVGRPPDRWRLFDPLQVGVGRSFVIECLDTDQIVSVVHQAGRPVDVLVEYD
ncbi:MAG TPA: M64 family metallopeptidase [Thermoleophilaceae bacterium]